MSFLEDLPGSLLKYSTSVPTHHTDVSCNIAPGAHALRAAKHFDCLPPVLLCRAGTWRSLLSSGIRVVLSHCRPRLSQTRRLFAALRAHVNDFARFPVIVIWLVLIRNHLIAQVSRYLVNLDVLYECSLGLAIPMSFDVKCLDIIRGDGASPKHAYSSPAGHPRHCLVSKGSLNRIHLRGKLVVRCSLPHSSHPQSDFGAPRDVRRSCRKTTRIHKDAIQLMARPKLPVPLVQRPGHSRIRDWFQQTTFH
jgi:hypothetical protein